MCQVLFTGCDKVWLKNPRIEPACSVLQALVPSDFQARYGHGTHNAAYPGTPYLPRG